MTDMQIKNIDDIPGFRAIGRRYPKTGEYFLDKRGQPQKANFDYALDVFDILVAVDEFGNDVPQTPLPGQSATITGQNNAEWSQALADVMAPLYSTVMGALELGAPNRPEDVKAFQFKLLAMWGQHAVDVMQKCAFAKYGEQGTHMFNELKKVFNMEMCLRPELIPKPAPPPVPPLVERPAITQPLTTVDVSPGALIAPPPLPEAPPPLPVP